MNEKRELNQIDQEIEKITNKVVREVFANDQWTTAEKINFAREISGLCEVWYDYILKPKLAKEQAEKKEEILKDFVKSLQKEKQG